MYSVELINDGKGLLNGVNLDRAIENTLTSLAKSIKVDFQVTTKTWKNKPNFIIKSKKGSRSIYTTSEIYLWVSGGTKAHKIRAKTTGGLRFQTGYKAKSIVGKIMSRAGGSFGPYVNPPPMEVNHPGTKARNFDQEIGDKWAKLAPLSFERSVLSEIA